MMNIGLFGGTFNPIHLGHMALARECLRSMELSKVIFIPAFMPPHKEIQGNASARDRAEMVELAIKGCDDLELSTYEIDKKGTSYSIDTIKYFIAKYGKGTEFFFLTGSDSLKELKDWKSIDEIMRLVKLVVAKRPGYALDRIYGDRVIYLEMNETDISSSVIREGVAGGLPVDHLMPSGVWEYIRRKGLYGEG
ncbi:MAG: nicotinate (nicotinamide) nucleotide adenylyltransferase [Candidatus Omnitrophica bacterium]|nr:nicotinate (nicotinamide) nucleotide adenylyltransferase [Candidatus Omnitrophota bacterium]